MTKQDIIAQSQGAIKQWGKQWAEQATIHSKWTMKPLSDFNNIGVGKACLLIANGYSFEENIEAIKELQDNVDILCCDKTLGHCLDNGIQPTYCIVCDANVDYDKYMKPWQDQLDNITMFINVCGNPSWTKYGNWKDIYFFVNKDVLKSEKTYSQLSGCKNYIPAATNVSNAMVVFLTQSDETGKKNYFGYDKYLLIGFDYCWCDDKHYYAFSKTGDGKSNYMRHIYARTLDGDFCYTSNNLAFSARWLETYVKAFNLPVVQCSQRSLLQMPLSANLGYQMDYQYKVEDGESVRRLIKLVVGAAEKKKNAETELGRIMTDHYYNVIGSI